MRDLNTLDATEVKRLREQELRLYGVKGGATEGVFLVKPLLGRNSRGLAPPLCVIASVGEGWDHVSVSSGKILKTPSWEDMDYVKRLFFKPFETAMQLHVPPSDHISFHDYTLHLWRPHGVEIPRPPGWMVGPAMTGTRALDNDT